MAAQQQEAVLVANNHVSLDTLNAKLALGYVVVFTCTIPGHGDNRNPAALVVLRLPPDVRSSLLPRR